MALFENYDLASEIVDENGLDDTKVVEMQLGYSKSGLLYRLNKVLNFDAKEIAKGSKEEQFKTYKLLKVLYKFEKVGEPKKIRAYDTGSEIKVRIIVRFLAEQGLRTECTFQLLHRKNLQG